MREYSLDHERMYNHSPDVTAHCIEPEESRQVGELEQEAHGWAGLGLPLDHPLASYLDHRDEDIKPGLEVGTLNKYT